MTIIVPYRDRADHLAAFLFAMSDYPDINVVVIEQTHGKAFNRAKLINVGFLVSDPVIFIAHDVDMIPVNVNYTPRKGVTQLASSEIQRHGYLGGVTMYDADTFRRAGGYHNEYWHRAEDNEQNFNLQRLRIPVRYWPGKFMTLPHPRTGPEFIPELWEKAQKPRDVQDQLSICEYRVIEHRTSDYTHLLVDI